MKGLIGYFDILGYQNFLKNNSAEESINNVFDIITNMPKIIKEFSEETINEAINSKEIDETDKKIFLDLDDKLNHLVFSDTIVFSLPLSYQDSTGRINGWEFLLSLVFFSACMSVLTEKMHEKGLPIRGVIHEGEFFTKEYCLAGNGIIEAYHLCETINFSGLVCSANLSEKILKMLNKEKELIHNDSNVFGLFTYYAPKKNGSEEKLIHINWPYLIEHIEENEKQLSQCRSDIEGYVLKSFWAHQKDCPTSVDIKVHNTKKLLRKMIYNIDIEKNKKLNKSESETSNSSSKLISNTEE